MLRDSIRRTAEAESAPHAAEIDRRNAVPMPLWRRLGELGLTVEEEHGDDVGYLARVVAMEEISRASASVGLSCGARSNLCVSQLRRIDQRACTAPMR